MNMAHTEREVLDMIQNYRSKATLTGYINNIYYHELFEWTHCPIQGYNIFYWLERQYFRNENIMYKLKRV